MVREQRPVQLVQGTTKLRLYEVSKQLDPQSLLLQWAGAGNGATNGPQIVAHAYDLGVADSDSLLKRYLGQEVEVVRFGDNGRESERQKGTLMVEGNGEIVLQSEGKFFVHPPGTIVAPTNGDIITIPQVSVQAESAAAQPATLDVAYLTRGLSWSADYVATLSPQANTLQLDCFATVINRTGADYPNAKVSLVAGTPNRAVRRPEDRAEAPSTLTETLKSKGRRHSDGHAVMDFNQAEAPVSMGDFYAYPVRSNTTVAQEQMNRLLLMSGKNVSVKRDYSIRLPSLYGYDYYEQGWGDGQQPIHGNVQSAVSFYNRAAEGLGAPLPQGDIRIYEPDTNGSLRYAGAATIQATPKEQKINLTLARAFDLYTESRIVKQQRINKNTVRKQVEVILHNEKAMPTDLRVLQNFGGRWSVIGESHKHVNLNAYDAQWTVNVPASGTTTLRYTVDLTG